ncbi:MAG: protein kinase [Planctomycetota bacterium]|nr:protein kinase [Planctomycetota bacterium]
MSATPTTVGPYIIERELGRGGMGVVYLGRDPRLDRAVAVKSLALDLAANPEFLARFEREARLLASLSHPNIATVYGLEEHQGVRYLVMEYLAGESLAARLQRGRMPIDEALAVVSCVAAALEAAHEANVIHRDLKPGNVILLPSGSAKILDFGLAKLNAPNPGSASRDNGPDSPTISFLSQSPAAATMPGRILGTIGYMSPEQARGRPVDRRTDLWAMGYILFECLTGRGPFDAPSASDAIAAILEREPQWSLLPDNTPPRIRELLSRCLEKDAGRRLRDAGDARHHIERAIAGREWTASFIAAQSGSALAAPRKPRRVFGVAALLFACLVGAAATVAVLQILPESHPPRAYSDLVFPGLDSNAGSVRITPDGSGVLTTRILPEGSAVYLRRDTQAVPTPVADLRSGGDGVGALAISPDGTRFVTQNATGELISAPVVGGSPLVLCVVRSSVRGINWADDGHIYFDDVGVVPEIIWRVDENGGTPEAVTSPDPARPAIKHRWPWALPGGRGVLFVEFDGGVYENADIMVWDAQSRQARPLLQDAYNPRWYQGCLFFSRATQVYYTRFDLQTLSIAGKPELFLDGLSADPFIFGHTAYDISRQGDVVYLPALGERNQYDVVWVDAQGNTSDVGVRLRSPELGMMSADRTLVGVTANIPVRQAAIIDLARKTVTRIPHPGRNWFVGFGATSEVAYVSTNSSPRGGDGIIEFSMASSRVTREIGPIAAVTLWRMSENGRIAVSGGRPGEPGVQVVDFTKESPKVERALREVPGLVAEVSPSPDGSWIAFQTTADHGVPTCFLVSTVTWGVPIPLGPAGLRSPQWAPDGKALYCWNESGAFCRISVQLPSDAGPPILGRPEQLFAADAVNKLDPRTTYVVVDNERFLMLRFVPPGSNAEHVVRIKAGFFPPSHRASAQP